MALWLGTTRHYRGDAPLITCGLLLSAPDMTSKLREWRAFFEQDFCTRFPYRGLYNRGLGSTNIRNRQTNVIGTAYNKLPTQRCLAEDVHTDIN